jgi:hypothetical protein
MRTAGKLVFLAQVVERIIVHHLASVQINISVAGNIYFKLYFMYFVD